MLQINSLRCRLQNKAMKQEALAELAAWTCLNVASNRTLVDSAAGYAGDDEDPRF